MLVIIEPSGPKSHHARGAELKLPASKAEILDALDQARIPYGSGEYQLQHHRDTPGFMKIILSDNLYNPSLAEMNHLAGRMEQMEEYERDMLDGILQIRGSYNITDAINATHNLHRFEYYPGVADDYTLGEVTIDACDGIYEPLGNVPDDLVDCLDHRKVGELVRKEYGSVFTQSGYLVPIDSGWDAVYDGQSLSERAVTLNPTDPIISLRLRPCDYPDEESYELRLDCPVSESDIDAVLKKYDIHGLYDCFIQSTQSVIPVLDYAITSDTDIERVNELAAAIKTLGGAQLAKYKAAYELEVVTDIETAIDLARRLDEYDFKQFHSIEEFGRASLAKTGMDIKLAEEYGFDFDAYGWKAKNDTNVHCMAYGFISRTKGQEQAVIHEHTEGPGTTEPESDSSPEQTMSM